MNVWHALETLASERNPRMVVIVEIEDAKHLLAVRTSLKVLATSSRVSKGSIAAAKQLLEMS